MGPFSLDFTRLPTLHQMEATPVAAIRSVSSKAICLDTEGPQIRIGNIKNIYLKQVDKVSINSRVSDFISIPLNYKIILKEGDSLSIGMHKLVLKVISTAQETLAEVIIPGLLSGNQKNYSSF